ncbi:alpha/beta hydrolase, partial [Candidatus Bipolaricaulota bacterium]|nr:alpha/beta hydrolase [Candidatus Bipolaricaulota bacterium]
AAVLFVNSGGFESGKLIQFAEASPTSYQFLRANELTISGSDPIPLLAQFSFEKLLDAGFTVFDVKHSNAHTVDAMLDDIRSAIVHIHEHSGPYHLDPNRIGIFGASSGGYLALASGLTTRKSGQRLISAIATYYPAGFDFPADVEAFPQIKDGLPALAVEDDVLNAVSIKNLYQAGGPPTLVIYGDQDFPFIINPCRSICSEFPKAGIDTKCVVIEGAAHEFMREDGYHPEDGHRAQAELVRWFEQQLAI